MQLAMLLILVTVSSLMTGLLLGCLAITKSCLHELTQLRLTLLYKTPGKGISNGSKVTPSGISRSDC